MNQYQELYQYYVNVSDLSKISGIKLTIFQLTYGNKINRNNVVDINLNNIDGKAVGIESDHFDSLHSQEQLRAICSILTNTFNLRCYRKKITSKARPKIYKE